MNTQFQIPSTLDGVKRLARRLVRQGGPTHTQALDQAAKLSGFNNYTDAKRRLPQTALRGEAVIATTPPGAEVWVTIGWRDTESRETGMERVSVRLSQPLEVLLRGRQLAKVPYVGHLRLALIDHLTSRMLAASRESARLQACQAARALQFMDATGLRPSSSRYRVYPGGDYGQAVPGMDHATTWYDPRTKAYILVDEPYRSVQWRAVERAAWAARHGYAIVETVVWGIYYPEGGTQLHLIADARKGYDLAPVKAALDALGTPPSSDEWSGVSLPLDREWLWSLRRAA